jgi:hypothetical protein
MVEQLVLPYGRVRNRELFSSHWLEHRLTLEPEWVQAHDIAQQAIERLADIGVINEIAFSTTAQSIRWSTLLFSPY